MTKKEVIPLLNIAQLRSTEDCGSIPDCFMVTGRTWQFPVQFEGPVRSSGGWIGLCTAGECNLVLNVKEYQIRSGDLFFVVPGSLVSVGDRSDDFALCLLCFSPEFLQGVDHSVNPFYPYIYHHPVLTPTDQEAARLLELLDLMYEKTSQQGHLYRKEIVLHLLIVLFYEVGVLFQRRYPKPTHRLTRNEELFKELMRLIKLYYKEERTVAFYAQELCLTPKYLSSVIKRTTQKSVIEWINEVVILNAKVQLRSSRMTVQQVANNLNFPNPSFFGRFFKKHVGMTPKAYRRNE